MLNVSIPPAVEDPGSPQSSTSTVNMTDPGVPLCVAMPLNCACLPMIHTVLGLITNVVTDVAFIWILALWSLYSRFPFGEQHVTEKPKVACPPTLAGLELLLMRSVANSSTVSRLKLSLGDTILPPPVPLPGVFGAAGQGGPGGLVSHGVKSTLLSGSTTASPVPPGLLAFVGPVELPHQLFCAFNVPECPPASTCNPARVFPLIQLR